MLKVQILAVECFDVWRKNRYVLRIWYMLHTLSGYKVHCFPIIRL